VDVHTRICQPGQRVFADPFTHLHHLAREGTGRPEVHRPVHSSRRTLDLATESLALSDLLSGWDADGFGDRERMYRVPGWTLQLGQDVPKQVLTHDRPVMREIVSERDGVAVDHRADALMIVDLVQRENPAHSLDRVGGQPPDAMAEPGAEQVLNNIALQVSPTCHGGAIEEERCEPILQVGVEQQPILATRTQDRDRADRLGDCRHWVLPHGCFMRKVLRQVADGGDTGLERVNGVGGCRRKPDHEIAHVGLDWNDLADLAPFGQGRDEWACLCGDAVA